MRIRSVKPEFFTHPEIVPLSIAARLLFISMWTQADDEGRMYDQPRKIIANAFGDADRVNPDKLMDELAKAGRVNRYEADGKPCLQVVHFSRHQRIDKMRPSTIPPGPFGEESSILPGIVVETSRPDLEVDLGKGSGNGTGKGSIAPAGARKRDLIWEWMVSKWGQPPSGKQFRGSWNVARKELEEQGLTVDECEARFANAGSRDWAIVTPNAFAKHVGLLANSEPAKANQTSRLLKMANDLERREHEAERSRQADDETRSLLPRNA